MPRGIAATARKVNVARDRWPILGLVYYWPLKDESPLQLDYYGQAALTCRGEPEFTTDRHGTGSAVMVNFEDNNGYISIPFDFPPLDESDWTINLWMQLGGGESFWLPFDWGDPDNEAQPNLTLVIDPDKETLNVIGPNDPGLPFDLPDLEWTDWHMITVTQQHAPFATSFYADGILRQVIVTPTIFGNTSYPFGIGQSPGTGVLADIALNDVSVHSKALQTQDVEWLYNGGLGRRYPRY